MDRSEQYEGKTVGEFITDLQLPVEKIYLAPDGPTGALGRITVHVRQRERLLNISDPSMQTNAIFIELERRDDYPETNCGAIEGIIRKRGGDRVSQSLDFLKDFEIMEIRVGISRESKYYEKYKNKGSKIKPMKRVIVNIEPMEEGFTPLTQEEYLKLGEDSK